MTTYTSNEMLMPSTAANMSALSVIEPRMYADRSAIPMATIVVRSNAGTVRARLGTTAEARISPTGCLRSHDSSLKFSVTMRPMNETY